MFRSPGLAGSRRASTCSPGSSWPPPKSMTPAGSRGRPARAGGRDTAADPVRAALAVDELARLGVAALAGEYHSVVARAAAARADALGLPFLCSSAVLDALTEQPTEWVARLAPAQSHGWQVYADFLLGAGHSRIAVAAEPSVYWASGARILRDYLAPRGGTVIELDARALTPAARVRRTRRQWRDGPPAAGRLPGAGDVDRAVRPPRPAPRRDPDRRSRRAAGVRRVGGVAWRRTAPRSRSCATCPGSSARSVPESRRPCASGSAKRPPSSPSRGTTRSPSSPMCFVRAARTGRASPNPGRACRRGHPRADPVLPHAGHQRLAMGLGAGPGR